MQESDSQAFALLIAGVYAYHRQPCSDALIGMYWRGCQHWDLEQVRRAVDSLTRDPEAGKFPPKIGDITRMLEGTQSDRAALAWGKALEAMGSVGAYTDVVFDDPAIHAAIEDLGGWPKVCRTEIKELGYLQHRFCEAYRAYVGRGKFDYPKRLGGDRSPDSEYIKFGRPVPKPAVIGDVQRARLVYQGGGVAKGAVSFLALSALSESPELIGAAQ